ncbi:hypothetical protein V1514DRAFT_325972 [Lipomyces japonicus]|uniref:uncharacterized protein n=1 Tax=Lipomyces japonicus TaxID=56871 RepID=UPI0034CD4A6B
MLIECRQINRTAEKQDKWILPSLYSVITELKRIALQADEHVNQSSIAGANDHANKLEEAARTVNRSLTVCLNDRNQKLVDSRKWAVYFVIGVLFKIYFKLGTISLATSVIRVLSSSTADMPSLEDYPKSHIVTFKYYQGVLAFMDEDFERAESNLQAALDLCHKDSIKNQELILRYLLPTYLLLHRKYPRQTIWKFYPNLKILYEDLFRAARIGDMRTYEAALAAREKLFVNKRLYLAMLQIRAKLVRPKLFEQIYIAKDRSNRMPVSIFRKGFEFVGIEVDDEQVECWASILIYQGFMKGYISRERKIVVLSNTDAFPKK